jgi:hypothetical protein
MPEESAARLKKLEERLAICYVVLMFCGAALLGVVIHELNLPALCRGG